PARRPARLLAAGDRVGRIPAGAAGPRLHAGRGRRATGDQPHRRGGGAARRAEDWGARRGALAARSERRRRAAGGGPGGARPAAGRQVFAPTARIVWGTPTQITIELALVLELPAPVRLVALGRLRAVLPDAREAIVRIQVDVLGVIDFDRAEAAVDATLVDSRLAQFALTGDMALRMSWGAQPSFL